MTQWKERRFLPCLTSCSQSLLFWIISEHLSRSTTAWSLSTLLPQLTTSLIFPAQYDGTHIHSIGLDNFLATGKWQESIKDRRKIKIKPNFKCHNHVAEYQAYDGWTGKARSRPFWGVPVVLFLSIYIVLDSLLIKTSFSKYWQYVDSTQ